jgi:hypothetical protein
MMFTSGLWRRAIQQNDGRKSFHCWIPFPTKMAPWHTLSCLKQAWGLSSFGRQKQTFIRINLSHFCVPFYLLCKHEALSSYPSLPPTPPKKKNNVVAVMVTGYKMGNNKYCWVSSVSCFLQWLCIILMKSQLCKKTSLRAIKRSGGLGWVLFVFYSTGVWTQGPVFARP